MRSWARATELRLCGLCGGHIKKGAPMLTIAINVPGRPKPIEKVRCETCADEPAPDMAPLEARELA